ncbi:HPr-rel-A system PqqD family peptide chaperone [Parahaliea sp. F7430]|uniref:HPr-rel-A system PqqD family peptide chaperone n=1 Tax=Sediminihaliea albiluteola TaxID=2758564 RepID=A0A7W2TVI7_9GAMM|nr:HPr-rel-A system PqqD family peptide chaperone [Sediminihaliea albiluteola]
MWRLTGPARFYDRSESAFVYYQVDSGDTHLLSETVFPILKALAEKQRSTTELLDHLCQSDGLGSGVTEEQLVQQLQSLSAAAIVTQD